MYRAKDLTGTVFELLMVQSRIGTTCNGESTWRCLCVCGNTTDSTASALRAGRKTSCGCTRKRRNIPKPHKHGQCRRGAVTPEYSLWKHAKARARKQGVPFGIEVSDIHIPENCPVMGIKLRLNKGRPQADSPSLDKFIPSLGYVKGNIWVISFRANSFKSDFTVEQLEQFVAAIRSGPTGLAGLSVRQWRCPCGAEHDRDVNAARNTLFAAAGCAVEVAYA